MSHRNIHDFFIYDFSQQLNVPRQPRRQPACKVCLRDRGYLGSRTVARAKPRKVSELVKGEEMEGIILIHIS